MAVKFNTLAHDPIDEWKKANRSRMTRIAERLDVSIATVSLVLRGERRNSLVRAALKRYKAPVVPPAKKVKRGRKYKTDNRP